MKDATQGNKRAIKVPRDCRSNISSPGANKVRKTGGQSSKIIGRALEDLIQVSTILFLNLF